MKKKQGLLVRSLGIILSLLLAFAGAMTYLNQGPGQSQESLSGWQTQVEETADGTLAFTGQKALVLENQDSLGRARSAHIQLRDRDEPTKKRDSRITYDPVGWHNYKLAYGSEGKSAWLMSRGHLVGYQFSGLNSEGRNLVPMTHWLNAGNYEGMDDSNAASMLYYENRLDDWLAANPDSWLDYKVTPIYQDDELLPRQVRLQYVGLSSSGNIIPISFGSSYESQNDTGITQVTLDNVSPNADINYKTGRATAKKTATSASSGSQVTVYVANQGQSKVYWYSRDNMPAQTNQSRVQEMTESQALAQGKTHASQEND